MEVLDLPVYNRGFELLKCPSGSHLDIPVATPMMVMGGLLNIPGGHGRFMAGESHMNSSL
jgi:hypothetical protein